VAKRKASGASGLKGFYGVVGVVAALGVLVVWFGLRGSGAGTASEPVDLGDIEDRELVELAQGIIWGDPNAPITIMEFGDYQCPACKAFAEQTKPQVELAYIESGQAKLVFHDFPLRQHPHSFLAARAARCAGDQGLEGYHAYHDALFRTQNRWSPERDATGHFKDLADELALDTGAFDACLESDRHADVVTANLQLGMRLGVSGTPSIYVDRGTGQAQQLGGWQFLDIQQAVEAGAGR